MQKSWKHTITSILHIWKLPLWQWGVIVFACFSLMWLFNIAFFLQIYLLAPSSTNTPVQPTMVFFQHFLPGEFSRRLTWIFAIPLGLYFIKKFPFRQQGNHAIAKYLGLQSAFSLGFGLLCAIVTALHAQITVPIIWQQLSDGVPSVWRILAIHFSLVSGFFASVALYWLMVFAVQAVQNLRAFRKERDLRKEVETELVKAQLYALQSQLQPHFLFNALNSVSSLMFEDIHRADRMIARLGEFLRISLNFHHIQMIPLGEEIGFVERYLEIEQMRFEERLEIHWSISDESKQALVPAFLLQPLVENAIKHGVSPLNRGGSITLSTRVHAAEKVLSLQVINFPAQQVFLNGNANANGNGNDYEHFVEKSYAVGREEDLTFVSSKEREILSKNTSVSNDRIGLKNTQARLEKLFTGSYVLDFGSVFSANPSPLHEDKNIGFFVNIRIPFQTA